MKNSIVLLILTFALQTIQAQKFRETTRYKAFSEISTKQQEYGPLTIAIKNAGETPETIATLTLEDPDLFEGTYISTLPNSGLEGIVDVVKVDMVYSACCTHVKTYYYLVTLDGKTWDLPSLENTYCDGLEAETQYFFPNMENGKEGQIVKALVHYEGDTTSSIEVLQSHFWNDDNFYSGEGGVVSIHE